MHGLAFEQKHCFRPSGQVWDRQHECDEHASLRLETRPITTLQPPRQHTRPAPESFSRV